MAPKAQSTAHELDVNPNKYPTLKKACEEFKAAAEGSGTSIANWSRIFTAAQTDGLLDPTLEFSPRFAISLKKDLSDVEIHENNVDDIAEILAQMKESLQ